MECQNNLEIFLTLDSKLSIIPLGGVEEIGINSLVFKFQYDMFIVDAGLMFPEDDMFGVDFVIPDYSYVYKNKELLKGIIITHGHEDHTGALPFLLREIGSRCPVYGTPLTIGLIKEKLKEYYIKDVTFKIVKPRDILTLGSFQIEFIKVTHSIADGFGLGITTPLGRIIHTGDFKFDLSPLYGDNLDFYKFASYGEQGVMLMLSDSTNSEHEGYTLSERNVKIAFEEIFSKASGRIIIATFASNIHRIQQAIDVAVEFGKKVILCGRSIVSNARISVDLGYLRIPDNTLYKIEQVGSINPDDTVIITTGSQGEPMSVLTRIACDAHKHIKIEKNDTVIVSAKVIPGNEKAVGKTIDRLLKRGANVVYDKISNVHVSGHASVEELKLMLNIVRPKYFVPIHGEYRQLVNHAKIAHNVFVRDENVFILQNGDVFEIGHDGGTVSGQVQAGRIYIDGKNNGDVNNAVLKERKRLARDGFIMVRLLINRKTREILQGPELVSKGFVLEDVFKDIIESASEIVIEVIKNSDGQLFEDIGQMEVKVQSVLKKFLKSTLDKKPLIMPMVIDIIDIEEGFSK